MVNGQTADLYVFTYHCFLKSLRLYVAHRILILFTIGTLLVTSLSSCNRALGLENRIPATSPPDYRLPTSGELLVHGVLATLSVSELAGQLLMIGLERTTDGEALTKLSAVERDVIDEIAPGGVVLYASNIDTITQTRRLVADSQGASALPLLIAIDHEGGFVSRLNASGNIPATEIPPAAVVGAAGDASLAFELGAVIGRELRSLGITMNFAPVADIDGTSGRGMMARQLRTYGTDVELVSEMVAATVSGMQASGVSAILKHYPGHGGTVGDSHDSLATASSSIVNLRVYDLPVFAAGINAAADGVMTAHVTYPAVVPDNLPATLSPFFLTTVLREELGFGGLVITDALNMASVAALMQPGDLAIACVRAGADILLKPVDAVGVHRALVAAIGSGDITVDRVVSSVRRILETKVRRGLFSPHGTSLPPGNDVIGASAHTAVVEEIKQLAKTRGM